MSCQPGNIVGAKRLPVQTQVKTDLRWCKPTRPFAAVSISPPVGNAVMSTFPFGIPTPSNIRQVALNCKLAASQFSFLKQQLKWRLRLLHVWARLILIVVAGHTRHRLPERATVDVALTAQTPWQNCVPEQVGVTRKLVRITTEIHLLGAPPSQQLAMVFTTDDPPVFMMLLQYTFPHHSEGLVTSPASELLLQPAPTPIHTTISSSPRRTLRPGAAQP